MALGFRGRFYHYPQQAKLVVETNSGCKSDTFSRTFKVNPNPVANFTLPGNICLPNGSALFTNTSTLADGTIGTAAYQWDFGDAASGTANTATTNNGTHQYSSTGPFAIKLQLLYLHKPMGNLRPQQRYALVRP
jgi:hypothetical protein